METQGKKQSGMNVKKTDNSKSSELERTTERIEGTPLIKVWEKDKGWSFGIIGYRISEHYTTEEEMMERVYRKEWQDIAGLISATVDATLKLYNLTK